MIINFECSVDVEDLFIGAIDVKPIQVESWNRRKLSTDWEYWEAVDYVSAGRTVQVVVRNGRRIISALDGNGVVAELDDIDTYLEDNTEGDVFTWDELVAMQAVRGVRVAEGPQMCWWYPLDGINSQHEDAAMTLRGLPLCVVQVDGVFGLALTGGGQDLTWDIAEAHVVLGYLPPTHFWDLPKMAGSTPNEYVLEAMLRSLNVTADRAKLNAHRLREMFPEPTFEYEILGRFNGDWEMVTTEDTPEAAQVALDTYRVNDPATSYRVKRVRATS